MATFTGNNFSETITPTTVSGSVTVSPTGSFPSAANDSIVANGGNDNIDASGGNDTIDAGSGNDTVLGGDGNDYITGGSGDDNINAGIGNDTIIGGARERDTIDGGDGTDLLDYSAISGRTYAITYTGDGAGNVVTGGRTSVFSNIERLIAAAGNDTISGSVFADWIQGDGGNDSIDGNDGDDQLGGGDGNDTINAGNGNDSMADGLGADVVDGGAGNDVIYTSADGSADTFIGGADTDTLDYRTSTGLNVVLSALGTGTVTATATDSFSGFEIYRLGTGNDTFSGSSGSDTVFGNTGNDSLSGGDGNDVFLLGPSEGTDTIDGGAGTADEIRAWWINTYVNWATVSNVEVWNGNGQANFRIVGSAAANAMDFSAATLTDVARIDGGAGDDTITGNAGNNTIIGGAGTDSLLGGAGNDTYLVRWDSAADVINDSAGTDTVLATSANSRVRWDNTSGVEVFDSGGFSGFRILGTASADLIDLSGVTLNGVQRIDGNGGNDTIIGNAADNTIDGWTGDDSLSGGDGNDTFLVRWASLNDTIDGGNGTADTLLFENDWARITWSNVSNVEVVNGNGHAHTMLVGTDANDTLVFTGVTVTGISRIDGGKGDDSIVGSSGADTIFGGMGADTLTGGAGSDSFGFVWFGQSGAASPDHITDFAAGDKIDLSLMDANNTVAGVQAFTWIGSAAFSAAGQLRAYDDGLGSTIVQGDVNGDGNADFQIVLDNNYAIGSGDFVGITV